jgi:nucleoid-associated protein YgaU
MGLFDFVTKAGSKLGGKIFDVTHDEVDITIPEQISPEELNESRAKSIIKNIKESGVDVENLSVVVAGENVALGGKVKTQDSYEKLALIAGNQFGISSVNCQMEIVNPEPESTFYTVKPGDTLSKIAKEFYGNASKYPVIFEANKPMLTDPNKIYVGQNLRIPPQ